MTWSLPVFIPSDKTEISSDWIWRQIEVVHRGDKCKCWLKAEQRSRWQHPRSMVASSCNWSKTAKLDLWKKMNIPISGYLDIERYITKENILQLEFLLRNESIKRLHLKYKQWTISWDGSLFVFQVKWTYTTIETQRDGICKKKSEKKLSVTGVDPDVRQPWPPGHGRWTSRRTLTAHRPPWQWSDKSPTYFMLKGGGFICVTLGPTVTTRNVVRLSYLVPVLNPCTVCNAH